MKATKRTPGPTHGQLDAIDDTGAWVSLTGGRYGQALFGIYKIESPGWLAETHAPIAHMFAAAPAMLAALEALITEADATGGNARTVSRYEVDRARTALLLARGAS